MLPWTCTRCGTRHKSDEEGAACDKSERATKRLVIGAGIVIAVAVLAIALVFNQFIYGDWRCAFAKCRIIKEKHDGP